MKPTVRKLKQAVDDYLLWMISCGYADSTIKNYEQILDHFVQFVHSLKVDWDNVFSSENIHQFHKSENRKLKPVRGLRRYLFKQKKTIKSSAILQKAS